MFNPTPITLVFLYPHSNASHAHCLVSWPAFFTTWVTPITTAFLRGFLIPPVIQSGSTIRPRGDVTVTRSLLLRSSGTTPRTNSFDRVTQIQSLIVTRRSGAHPDYPFHEDQSPWDRAIAQLNQQTRTCVQLWTAWLIHTGRIVAGFLICSSAGRSQILTGLQKEIRQLEKEIEQADTTKLAPPLSETELIQQLVCREAPEIWKLRLT